MIIVLTGAPGAGKGTQADLLVEREGFYKLSTGDALRRQIKLGTDVGKKAESVMAEGRLVSDEILLEILTAELGAIGQESVLLDGYPRNISQARTLKENFSVSAAIHLDVDDSVLLARLCGRRVCQACGASYHLEFAPPSKEGVCDKCGEDLHQRPDDNEDKVKTRLKVYRDETMPVLEFYKESGLYKKVDGLGATGEVYSRLLDAVNSFK